MNRSETSRLLIWTGPVFAVAFLGLDLALGGNPPGEGTSGRQVVDYVNAHHGRTMAEAFVVPALAALLVLFAGELRARARGGAGAGALAILGGAVLWASGILLGGVIDLGLVTASSHHEAQVAQTLNVLNNDDWIPFIAGLAIFMIGAGDTVLRSRMLPTWLGWVALLVGIASLAGPGGFLGYFAAPAWIVVASILLAVRADRAVPGGEEDYRAASAPAVGQLPVPTR